MAHKLIALSILSSTVLAAPQSEDHITNKQYDPKKTPALNEPVLSTDGQAVSLSLHKGDCSKEQVWSVQGPHKIAVTATKDQKLPVPGTFDRIAGQLLIDKNSQKLLHAEGTIDLLSFTSGVPDRDRRVQRYILKAESNPLAIFKAAFQQGAMLPASGSTEQQWKATLTFADEVFDFDLRMKAERLDRTSLRLSTIEPASLAYVRDSMNIGLQKLLELCNHKFLAKTVKLSMEMVLKSECPAR